MTDISAMLSEDLNICRLVIHEGPDPDMPGHWKDLASIDLDAPALSQLLLNLGASRAKMGDRVPRRIDGRPNFRDVTRHPSSMIGTFQGILGPEVYLALRHEGFGWLAFSLSVDEVSEIVAIFAQTVSDMPRPKGLVLPGRGRG